MAVTHAQVRTAAYYDSALLMQVQRFLATLPGVLDAAAMMATPANLDLLDAGGLLPVEAHLARPDDLLLVVRAADDAAAAAALAQADGLLARRREGDDLDEPRPRTLEAAARLLPEAGWVLVSVAGRYAARVARQALRLGKHVFLYSDNVPVEDEVALKRLAAERGLLVLGPDCGTAIVNGVGLGFANAVRRGPIGLVAASGTGLQHLAVRLHALGTGVSHALGTGGRDLSEAVGGLTTRQCLDLLDRDPDTRVIVLLSKPPSPRVADQVLALARSLHKPVVADLIGAAPHARRIGRVHLARTLDEAAELAAALVISIASGDESTAGDGGDGCASDPPAGLAPAASSPGPRCLRALFSGGTLAYELQLLLHGALPGILSNAPLHESGRLADPAHSRGHVVLDLGADEFTVGRLHPMIDNDLRLRRLAHEAADPACAVLLLDVVLGYGAHPDPASELAPAVAAARRAAADAGRLLHLVVLLVGTELDPQDLAAQAERFRAAGAHVETTVEAAVDRVLRLLPPAASTPLLPPDLTPVDLADLHRPLAALNVGLASFVASLHAQGAAALHLDWRPPAGGDERLAALLERMSTTPLPSGGERAT